MVIKYIKMYEKSASSLSMCFFKQVVTLQNLRVVKMADSVGLVITNFVFLHTQQKKSFFQTSKNMNRLIHAHTDNYSQSFKSLFDRTINMFEGEIGRSWSLFASLY